MPSPTTALPKSEQPRNYPVSLLVGHHVSRPNGVTVRRAWFIEPERDPNLPISLIAHAPHGLFPAVHYPSPRLPKIRVSEGFEHLSRCILAADRICRFSVSEKFDGKLPRAGSGLR